MVQIKGLDTRPFIFFEKNRKNIAELPNNI